MRRDRWALGLIRYYKIAAEVAGQRNGTGLLHLCQREPFKIHDRVRYLLANNRIVLH